MNTDRAWNLLYARLKDDGLIPAEVKRTPPGPLRRFSPAGRAALALILCAAAAALALLQNNGGQAGAPFLTLHNEKGGVTLVTTLEDGSIVYLADDSRLYYPPHFMPGKREVSLKGEALFDVKGNRERPFLITTQTARIEVTGTAFKALNTDNKPLELSVGQGEVKVVVRETGRSMYAKAGETLRLTSSGNLRLEQTPEGAADFSRYMERIRFKDEKLSDVLEVINRRGGEVVLRTTPLLENRKITATFLNDTPESIARLICTAFNLICEKENNILLISEP
jgi:ferric-dicitrate binding protein FerR (iron transport regulator)